MFSCNSYSHFRMSYLVIGYFVCNVLFHVYKPFVGWPGEYLIFFTIQYDILWHSLIDPSKTTSLLWVKMFYTNFFHNSLRYLMTQSNWPFKYNKPPMGENVLHYHYIWKHTFDNSPYTDNSKVYILLQTLLCIQLDISYA